MTNEYEGDDRRRSRYSNIQHPLLLKPEFLLSMISSAAVGIVLLTLHVDNIDDKAEKANNKIEHYRELQLNENSNVKEAIDELKDRQEEQYKDLKHDINRLIDRELSLGDNHE